MKALFVSLLVLLSAGFAQAQEEQEAPHMSVEEAMRLQELGQRLNLGKTKEDAPVYGPVLREDDSDFNFNQYEFERNERLRAECLQRRRDVRNADEIPIVGGYVSDFVRQGQRNVDGGTVVRRNDGTSVYLENDRCANVLPREREETDQRGCRWRVNGSTRKLIGGLNCRG
jgi:hypothetical protein